MHWGIQNGLQLSRSTIVHFKHNDMESLRNTLEKVTQQNKRAEKVRRYIVVEAVYQVLASDMSELLLLYSFPVIFFNKKISRKLLSVTPIV